MQCVDFDPKKGILKFGGVIVDGEVGLQNKKNVGF